VAGAAVALRVAFAALLFALFLSDFCPQGKNLKEKSLCTSLPQANPADQDATA
jgi:hypothetical protein